MTVATTTRPGDALKEELLRGAVEAAATGDADAASALLGRLTARHLDLDSTPSDLTYHIFASSLARRLDRDVSEQNLYLQRFDLSQISLFNLLAEHFPLVRLGGALGNEVLAAVLPASGDAVLLDIGIGTGQQEVALIDMLARRRRLPARLHVIAVEPSRTSLVEAERAIAEAAAAAGLTLQFSAIEGVAEALDDGVWARLAQATSGTPLVVNAAFAMHHVQRHGELGPAAAREAVLRRVRALEPEAVVLIEPNSDHDQPDLRRRFEHCWWHFGAIFRLIDRLDVTEDDRAAMKLFFAREIEDVLANSESTRCERHEPTSRWLDRLTAAGFHPAAGLEELTLAAGHGVSLEVGEGYAGLAIDGDLIASVICAGSRPLTLQLRPIGDGSWPAVPARAAAPLARLRVRDIMDRDPPTISADASLAQAAQVLWETGVSDLAVLDADGRFAGVLSEGDVIRRLLPGPGMPADGVARSDAFELVVFRARHAGPQPIAPLVIANPVALEPTDDVLLVATEMIARQIRRLPVVDADRVLVGSVSRADVCRALLCR